MNSRFRKIIKSIEDKYRRLISSQPAERSKIPIKGGVYLFSKGKKHKYVGRAKNLKRRVICHSMPSVKDAPFAFRLARKKTKRPPTYRTKGSRNELWKDPKFRAAYAEAQKKIKKMDVRYVKEEKPINQALLEIYTAFALSTPYNDFEVH
ncbi:MAG: hypothetical protein JW873_03805 [Candidatus Saganbacteria bacterium]|nr:hypothetical protein [Candidatus Saganbacteria bacterium]